MLLYSKKTGLTLPLHLALTLLPSPSLPDTPLRRCRSACPLCFPPLSLPRSLSLSLSLSLPLHLALTLLPPPPLPDTPLRRCRSACPLCFPPLSLPRSLSLSLSLSLSPQYCKCLAQTQPLQCSQEDMPNSRKRIYQELCEGKLKD